jgi:hypothetical protein
MLKKFYRDCTSPKSKIGFIHGFISIFGAITLSYLSMMCFAKYIPADFATKIIPTYVLTPILIPIYFIWILFSKTIMSSILKLTTLTCLLVLLLKVIL